MAAPIGIPLVPDKETIVQQTYLEALQSNLSSVQKWTSWKEDHERLKKTLTDLPNKLSHQAVIPFGSKALVRAKIVHTNEILSCVGDGWFIKQSANQAVGLCDRRIKDSERMLESLEKERDLIQSRQTLPKAEDAFGNQDDEEIVEEFDEEKETEWRARHREMERKYHQELAELRKKREEESQPQTEEELFRRLDMLELEEELNDELDRLNCELDSDEEDESSDEQEESEEEDEKKDGQEKELEKYRNNEGLSDLSSNYVQQPSDRTQSNANIGDFQKVQRNTSAIEPGQVSFGFTDSKGNEWRKPTVTNTEVEHKREPLKKSGKSVSFASDIDDAEDGREEEVHPDIVIRFKHSDNEFQNPSREDDGSGDGRTILSPRDIYSLYAPLMAASVPKSVLKKTSSYESESSYGDTAPTTQPFGSSLGLTWQDEDGQIDGPRSPAQDSSLRLPMFIYAVDGAEFEQEKRIEVRRSKFIMKPPCEQRKPEFPNRFVQVLQDVVENSTNSDTSEQLEPEVPQVTADRPVSRFKASRAAARK